MKKAVKIIGVAILSVFLLVVLYNSIVVDIFFAMPSGMKKENVCFLAPGLAWNSTMSDVKDCFGEPVEKSDYNDITGAVINTYKSEYMNRPMTVYAERDAFLVTMPFHRLRVFSYTFIIDCSDREDAKVVFAELCDGLTDSEKANERFECEIYNDNEFSAKIGYGPTAIYYDAVFADENEVRLMAYASY